MVQERSGVVTLAGNPVTLIGSEVRVGDKAPNFEVLSNDRSKVTLEDSKGKIRIITCVPSLDTGVCDVQTRKFNEAASELGNHYSMSFGTAYGTYMKEHRLECRAVFVVDDRDVVTYAEYVKEVTNQPNYEAALDAVKSIVKVRK
jgi:thioredoxin-dependent peroxiredoxin